MKKLVTMINVSALKIQNKIIMEMLQELPLAQNVLINLSKMLVIPVNVNPDISQPGLLMLILSAKPNVQHLALTQQLMELVLAIQILSGQNVKLHAHGTIKIKALKLLLKLLIPPRNVNV